MNESISLAVIGGSGLYQMAGLRDTQEHFPETPFGKPSAPIVVGALEGKRVAFLARHGIGHSILPSEVNFRANIYALKMLGAERVIGVNACGSLREHLAPGHIIIPDQIFDFTRGRARTFFGEGLAAHIGAADPFCADLSAALEKAVRQTGAPVHKGGTFLVVEGPRFSTKAESRTFRAWGMDIIGMTTSPEVFLAREAEMCYAVMAHITDYDVWHETEEPVNVEMLLATLAANAQLAQQAIRILVPRLAAAERTCECSSTLSTALITQPDLVPESLKRDLAPIVGKYLK